MNTIQLGVLPNQLGPLYQYLKKSLKEYGVPAFDQEARLMLAERTGYGWGQIIAHDDLIIEEHLLSILSQDLSLRLSGKPLSKIYGSREFWGLPFFVNEHVLDPRPDTETIIELALRHFNDKSAPLNILDLGTGSGCILIALLNEFPNSKGVGADISSKALEIASRNANTNCVAERAEFITSNWFDSVSQKECFDLIVSNPPYIRESVIPELAVEVKNYDPILALDGGKDGLDPYKIIFSQLFKFLKPHGLALFEIGYDQKEDIMRLGRESRFESINVHPDLAGQPRVAEIRRGDK